MMAKKGTKSECLKLGIRPIMPTLWDAEAEGSTLVPDKPGLYDSPNQDGSMLITPALGGCQIRPAWAT